MGRKIPKTRRHKKLKFVDPCYTGPTRHKKGKRLPNEPPTKEELDLDQQEVPAAMHQFTDVRNKVKQNQWKNKKSKRRNKPNDHRIVVTNDLGDEKHLGKSNKFKSVPHKVEQKKRESRQQFFDRLQAMADTAFAEARIGEKYDGDVIHVDKKSGVATFLPCKDNDTQLSERKKRQRLKQKEKKMKKRKLSEEGDDKFKNEEIKFGEVALQPPSLDVKPKTAVQSKAGTRDLFLKKLLNKDPKENSSKKIFSDFSQKRKMLLPGQRRMLEAERLRAVDLYRSLKQSKRNKS